MNVFEMVKQSVTTRQAAELYGFKLGRNQMISCPFHHDRTPSMKVDRRFHCFGCGADGDVIDFVSRLYGISSLDAAKKLALALGLSCDMKPVERKPGNAIQKKQRRSDAEIYAEAEHRCFQILADYEQLLKKWEHDYAPRDEDEELHPLFVEAMQRKTHVEYLLDILAFGEIGDKALLVMDYGKEVAALERRISEFACTDAEEGFRSS